jgi:hypothetical protein
MDANDQCHRIVLDSHVYSNEFHSEHGISIEIDRTMLMEMYKDTTEVALEFVKQLVNDDNVENEIEDSMIKYYSDS